MFYDALYRNRFYDAGLRKFTDLSTNSLSAENILS